MNRRSFSSAGCALGACLLTACAATSTVDHPTVAPGKNIALTGRYMLYENLEGDAEFADIDLGEGDFDTEGYGAEVAFLRGAPDILLGWDEREYEDDVDATEFYFGVRMPFGIDTLRPYFSAKVRYGLGVEFGGPLDVESDDYWGWALGGGLMAWLTESLYLDFNLAYEDMFTDIEIDEVDGLDLGIDGLVGTVGIGFAF